MLSIAVPSRTEKFLDNTIRDVLENATGEIELFAVLDGYDIPDSERIKDPRLKYILLPDTPGVMKKRQAVHEMVEQSHGEYLMSLDAHCLVEKGFDERLAADHQPNWVQIPRRQRLDAENWCLQTQVDKRPPIDYEYTMWPMRFDPIGLHGFKWDARTLERKDIMIDETMHFQGSCWFMTRDWFNDCGMFQIEGYTGWGQEAEELAFKTRKFGGKVITNKNTYYAHLHKGPKYGRMYYMPRSQSRASTVHAYQEIVQDNKEQFIEFIEQFWPVPGWPENWKEQLWTQ